MRNIRFARNLVKGKIAETIFAQMFRQTKEFTVLEFGYEKIIPELVQQGNRDGNQLIETLRTAPDFAVINKKTRDVQLIEVKYMKTLNFRNIIKYAERMSQSWNPSYLFIATLDGFYFDEIDTIINNNGRINPLELPQIGKEMQHKYMQILIDFEKNN